MCGLTSATNFAADCTTVTLVLDENPADIRRGGVCLCLIADGSRMFVRKEVEREGRCQLVCYLCEDLPSCPLYDALANSAEMYLHIPTENGFARLALQLQGVLVVGLVGLFLYVSLRQS